MNLANELIGIKSNLEQAIRIVGDLDKENPHKQRTVVNRDICIRLDMTKEYIFRTLKQIERTKESMLFLDK